VRIAVAVRYAVLGAGDEFLSAGEFPAADDAAAPNSISAPRVLDCWMRCIAPWVVESFHLLRRTYRPSGPKRSLRRTAGPMCAR
jgi:hypothetical protein